MKSSILALTFLAVVLPLSAQQITISKDNKTIAITTTGDASALADTAVVTIGFNTYGKDQDSTYADATRISNTIIEALTKDGVPKDAIQSHSQNLSALDTDNNRDKARYSQGLRYEFSQSWQVMVPAAHAADTLHLAITSGANNSGQIEWQLQHDDALQAEAAQNALKHAREIADHMAQGLSAKLGQLVYASNQTPPRNFFGGQMNFATLESMSASVGSSRVNLKPLAISPDRITKTATVYAVFAIE
jgi:uncharacterized protein YggE